MPWARLDDKRAIHPKLAAAGFAARGLDEAAICWCSMHETDGNLTESDVQYLASVHGCRKWRHLVAVLVEVGRWHRTDTGWVIHDFLEFNPSKAATQDKREKRKTAGHLGGIAKALANARPDVTSKPGSKTPSTVLHPLVVPRPVPSRRDKSSVVTTAPRDPTQDNDDDDDLIEKALTELAERRLDRVGRASITNPPGYRRSVLASLRTELADQIAAAPAFDTAAGYVNWLEPPSPAEQHAAAQAAIRQRNDAPQCARCDGNTRIETPQGAIPCPACQTGQ